MNRFLFGLFLLIFSFGFSQNFDEDSAAVNNYEHILNYHSDIEVSKDASITVTEKIKVYAEGINIRRGIFRSLPVFRNINGQKKPVDYDLISVKKNGVDEDYHTKNENGNFVIYLGNKDTFLEKGIYDYEIKYRTKDQIGFFGKYDELYWNVNGTLWDFNVDRVSAKVTLPEGAEILQNSCYTGGYRSTASNCISKILSSNSIEWTSENLGRNEGLTVAVGFKKGIITAPPPPTFLEKYGVLSALILAVLALAFYFYHSWQKFGIDPVKPVVYPQFNAPQNLSPASLGYINRGFYSNNFISAALVNLAIKGFIKIIEKDERVLGIFGGKTYTLEKLKEPDQTLPKEEISLMNKFFANSKSVKIDGSYSKKIENAVRDFEGSLSFQHAEFLNEGNNGGKVVLPTLFILGLYALGLFFSYRSTYSNGHLFGGIALVCFLLFIGGFLVYFFERYVFARILFWIIAAGLLFADAVAFSIDDDRQFNLNFYACYLFLILGFVGIILYQWLIKKPSLEKVETQSLIDGFKMYLGTAEEKTLQFHNPPQMTPEVFEKMLPYAMVLGVDKIWGDKFQNVLKNSAVENEGYQTGWYVGNSPMNFSFAHTLNSSLSSSIASSSTQPSSSGSGSGGGGFSGGGGGGGGGGGW